MYEVAHSMKRKQAKLSSFLAPDGPNVHPTEPKLEPMSSSWTEPVVKDDFGPKRRVLPSTIAKGTVGLNSAYTFASKTVSTFRPPERIGDPSYLMGSAKEAIDEAALQARAKRKGAPTSSDEVTLSASQKRVLDTIVARKSVFFTGAAGTGKSYVLKIIREVLENLGLSDKVSFTAPTGVAACNIRGLTIHAWAGIGMGSEPKDQLAAIVGRSRVAAQRWRECEILVIDEISMLSAELFDKLSFIGSRVRNDPRPFGGLQLVLCGDFFQLPPVGLGKNTLFCFESKCWEEIFGGREDGMILLDKVFRQQNDTVFLGILNDLRMGVVTPQAQRVLAGKVQESYRKEREANLLKESSTSSGGGGGGSDAAEGTGSAPTGSTVPAARARKGFAIPKAAAPVVAVRPTKLFSTNKDVDAFNNIELQKLADADAFGDCYRYEAIDEGREPYLNQLRQGTKAPALLELRVGAQVMLLKNLSTVRGLVNGARGTVVGFEKSQNRTANQPYIPVVTFQVYLGASMHEETISVDQETWDIKQGERTLASRVQIPLMLAWAISIHKSQGMTIPLLEVSFNNIFEFGQGYVALSRATCLEGLTLRSFSVSAIKAHSKVCEFYNHIGMLTNSSTSSTSSTSTTSTAGNSSTTVVPAGAQEVTARVSDLAKAFVLEAPAADTSGDWMESKHAKTAQLKKVISTYKANVHTIDRGEDDDGEGGEGEFTNPYTQNASAMRMQDVENYPEEEEEEDLMYIGNTAATAATTTTSARSSTQPGSNAANQGEDATRSGGNKFSRYSLPLPSNTSSSALSSSTNDWLDDEPTAAQKAAARSAYQRQAEKAITEAAAATSAAVNTEHNMQAPKSGAALAVSSTSTAKAVVPHKTEPLPPVVPTAPSVSTTWTSAATMTNPGPFSYSPARSSARSSESTSTAVLPPAPPPQPQSASGSGQPVSLLNMLASHRTVIQPPPQPPQSIPSGQQSIAAVPAAAGGMSDEVKRRIEANRQAALQRLQENRRKREEETNRLLQEYKV